MGLFNLFKKPVKIQDDLFGEMRSMDFKDKSKNYFEGKGYFAPTQSKTDLLIDADIEGPTTAQKEFFIDLQNNFDQYIQKIKPLIEDEFRNWKDNFEIQDFNKEFTLVHLTIPRMEVTPLKWEMAFTTIHDANHHVTIDFTDKEPTGILIDG